MTRLVRPLKARPGDAVAVLSPAFAAPGVAPAVHEQAMQRLTEATGLVPVEYPTTRRLGASPQDRAADLNAAFSDSEIRAVLATIGGDDQITVVPHLDPEPIIADPKPFLGYSDNANLSSWLWTHGVASFYGGSTQVHLGPGPDLDTIHRASLRAALLTGERLEITDPGESEDYGVDWREPGALTDNGQREPTEPWTWAGPARTVTGRSWGGCLEVIQQILMAGRFPSDPGMLTGGVLLLETSEEVISATDFRASAPCTGGTRCPGRCRCRAGGAPASVEHRAAAPRGSTRGLPRRAGRRRDRHRGALQPRSGDLRRGALRTHSPAVDPALRRGAHRRRLRPEDLRGLPLRTSPSP